VPDWWRWSLARGLRGVRSDGRTALLWTMRITTSAVSAYVVATLLFPGTRPLLAPLTAMLVVQVTPVSLITAGLDRVVAVVAGVFLAIAFSAVVPLEWWSLGLLIFLALAIGQVLRVRMFLIEVAISAMLVLGVGSLGAETAAWQRIAQTLVGAVVGIVANLLVPPKVATADAGKAVDDLADSLSRLLSRAADELAERASEGREVAHAARAWLDEARRITHDIAGVGAALQHAEQGRRLNVRAVGTPDPGPGLRQGLEALEHCAVAVRAMLRGLADATQDPAWPEDETARTVLLGLAETFREMAVSVDAFGQLVRNQALSAGRMNSEDVAVLREALDGLREARARSEDLLTMAAEPVLLELHAAVLSTVKRLESEMDLDAHIRRQNRMLPSHRGRLARVVEKASGIRPFSFGGVRGRG
jgi:Fusaric acid resistance protein-like